MGQNEQNLRKMKNPKPETGTGGPSLALAKVGFPPNKKRGAQSTPSIKVLMCRGDVLVAPEEENIRRTRRPPGTNYPNPRAKASEKNRLPPAISAGRSCFPAAPFGRTLPPSEVPARCRLLSMSSLRYELSWRS